MTVSGTTGTLYVNGAVAATNPNMTLRPSDMGVTANNWIGRSQYPDPFLSATVDDFHIYDRALDAAEVGQLASGTPGAGSVVAYRFDESGGAEVLDTSGNGRNATIVSPPVNVVTPQGLTGYWEAPYIFKRKGTYYLAYARGNPRTGGNPATIDYATASAPFGPWTYRGRILDTVNNTTTNHAAIVEFENRWLIVYHNGMLPGGGEFRRSVCIDDLRFNPDGTIRPVVQTLSSVARRPVARYTFDERRGTTILDQTRHGWDGALVGGATRAPGVAGRAMRLDGHGQYASLPAGILWNMYDFTLAAWVNLDTPGDLQHVFDFGRDTTANMYAHATGLHWRRPVRDHHQRPRRGAGRRRYGAAPRRRVGPRRGDEVSARRPAVRERGAGRREPERRPVSGPTREHRQQLDRSLPERGRPVPQRSRGRCAHLPARSGRIRDRGAGAGRVTGAAPGSNPQGLRDGWVTSPM